jgi:MFS family permease
MRCSGAQSMDESLAYQPQAVDSKRSQLVLLAACLGVMTVVVDSTVVNVALPSIRADLKFSDSLLVWVMNGYFVPYGGALLICGRLGDYYGHARLFLIGMVVFTLASIGCALAWAPEVLVSMRVAQGLGAAATQAVTYALIMATFRSIGERAHALGLLAVGGAGGGSAGILVGGILTSALGWRWIFLINIPVGLVVCGLVLVSGRAADRGARVGSLDIAGATSVTAALTLCLLATASATQTGVESFYTLSPLAGAALLMWVFVTIELRARTPIAPLVLFADRNFRLGIIANALWNSAQFVWFFISALYLQGSLSYDVLHVALAFLPANIVIALFSLGASKWLVVRFGTRWPTAAGPLLVAAGLGIFSRAPTGASFTADVLPAMLLVGLGCGTGYNALVLSTLRGVPARDYGFGSGLINTASIMAGCIAIAILANVISVRAESAVRAGEGALAAATAGYQFAFAIGAALACAAALIGGVFLQPVKDGN